MTQNPLVVQELAKPRAPQDIDAFGFTANEMLGLLGQFDPYGVWKIDLATGKVLWSPDVYEIHELNYTEGSVDLTAAINAYHPDDAKMVAQLIDETIENKTGFRFVLRLKKPDGTHKLVKCTARHRITDEGKEEIFGLFSQFQPPIRTISSSSV